jgi:hypothetical protein
MESIPLSACRKIQEEIASIIMYICWIGCIEFLKINIVSQNSAVHDVASFQHAGTFFTFIGA